MSAEANKLLVRRFLTEVWNAGNQDAAGEFIHPDYDIPGVGHGPEAVRQNMAAYRSAFPDLEWTIEQIIAEDDWVAARLTLHGTHLGEFRGIPPTGRCVAMPEMVFWRVVDGKLHTLIALADALGLRIQLGAIPATAWHQPVIGPGSPATTEGDGVVN